MVSNTNNDMVLFTCICKDSLICEYGGCFTKIKIHFKLDLTMAGHHATVISHHLLALVSQGMYKSWSQINRIYIFYNSLLKGKNSI